MTAPACPVSLLDSFYFGKPGAMVELGPDSGITAPLSRGEVAHALADGGVTTTRRRRTRRVYGLSFAQSSPDAAEVLVSYYTGSRGAGPWCLVDPTYRNQLPLDTCTMGASYGALPAGSWAAMAGDTAAVFDASVAPPVRGTALAKVIGAGTTHPLLSDGAYGTLAAGLSGFAASSRAVPYLSDQPLVFSIYVRAAVGTPTVSMRAYGATAAGGAVATGATGAIATSTGVWARLTLPFAAGAFAAGTETVHLGVYANAASQFLIAAAQIEYGVAAAQPWVTGLGVPRVTISAPLGGASSIYWRRSHGLTLAEV